MASVIKSYPTLVSLCRNVEAEYFKKGIRENTHRASGTTSGRSSRNEGDLQEMKSGRSSRNDTLPKIRSRRTSRTEEEATKTSSNASSNEKNGSNGEYDKLEDFHPVQKEQTSDN